MSVAVSARRTVFLTGGTGYVGSRLIPQLLQRGHAIRAMARRSSISRLPSECDVVAGDVLDPAALTASMAGCDTVVQLVGTPRPTPWKGTQFRAIDRPSGLASVAAARETQGVHFIYVSVAHPAPVMRDYIAVRAECEAAIRASGLRATIVRPWYVLGPGHWWPLLLTPCYWICERMPKRRASALRLGLVTIHQMLNTLLWAVEHPPESIRIIEVPDIRHSGGLRA
jgi:nucleoside-diphosphate-sugar epimerase